MRSRCSWQGHAQAICTAVLIWAFAVSTSSANADVIPANNLPDDTVGWVELLQEPPENQPWDLSTALSHPAADWTPLTDSVLNFRWIWVTPGALKMQGSSRVQPA